MKKLLLQLGALGCLSSALWALPQPVGENTVHKVSRAETLFTISRQYGLAPDHLLWANGLSSERALEPGQELLVPLRRIPPFTPPESTAIVLNLPERMLYLFRDHQLVDFWGVAIGGMQYPTPSGTFRILDKEKDPVWEPPAWLEREAVGPGPDNPLGDRWMQLTPNMVGIHGTNNPDSIGGVASLGCVRLYPESVRALYDQVSVGTPVYAVYEQVRLGEEVDGSLVWSFFPDPYTKYYAGFQAREALELAKDEGFDAEISDFEIEERKRATNGLITPVFGTPIKVESAAPLPTNPAIQKPTGCWLNPNTLTALGLELTHYEDALVLTHPTGKRVEIFEAEIPLNPYRLPVLQKGEPLQLEGHRWRGEVWAPMLPVLQYFEIEHKWDKQAGLLVLKGGTRNMSATHEVPQEK